MNKRAVPRDALLEPVSRVVGAWVPGRSSAANPCQGWVAPGTSLLGQQLRAVGALLLLQ